MADERKAKSQDVLSKWAAKPPDKNAAAIAEREKRQELFSALNEFIRKNGGAVVSVPGAERMRIEVPVNSQLPAKLSGMGYSLLFLGTSERILSGGRIEVIVEHGKQVTRRHAAIVPVEIIELHYPEKDRQ